MNTVLLVGYGRRANAVRVTRPHCVQRQIESNFQFVLIIFAKKWEHPNNDATCAFNSLAEMHRYSRTIEKWAKKYK